MKDQKLTHQLAAILFPQPFVKVLDSGKIIDLPNNAIPQNCEILLSGMHQSKHWGQNIYYLVQIDNTLVYLYVCSNMPECSFDEFAVIEGVANSEAGKERLYKETLSFLENICFRIVQNSNIYSKEPKNLN